jgi:hypothetical protein
MTESGSTVNYWLESYRCENECIWDPEGDETT